MILLCFFLLLTRYAAPDPERQASAVDSLKTDFHQKRTGAEDTGVAKWLFKTSVKPQDTKLASQQPSILEIAKELKEAEVSQLKDAIVISIPADSLFTRRDGQLKASYVEALGRLFSEVSRTDFPTQATLNDNLTLNFSRAQARLATLYRFALDSDFERVVPKLKSSENHTLEIRIDEQD